MYNPSIGRWLTPDPIGFDGGDVNLYGFVGNSPTNYTDPSGLQKGVRGNSRAAAEAAFIALFPAGKGALKRAMGSWADEARDYAQKVRDRYPNPTYTPEHRQMIQNSARHLYWQAMLTARYGRSLASHIGDLHEYGESCVDSLIDKNNNAIAQAAAAEAHKALLEKIEPILSQYRGISILPSDTFDTIKDNLLEAFWKAEEANFRKSLTEALDKMTDESMKNPHKGPIIFDYKDPRLAAFPGWKADLPLEGRSWWDSQPSK